MRKKGGMSKRLRKQKALASYNEWEREHFKSLTLDDLYRMRHMYKGLATSGYPHIKEMLNKYIAEIEKREKKK